MANRYGNSDRLYFLGLQNHWGWWVQPWISKVPAPWKKSFDKSRQHIKKQRHYFSKKGLSSQSYGFSSSHIWMWELHHKEGSVPKNGCFQIFLEKTLESPLDSEEIKPVNPKRNQPWRGWKDQCWSWSSNTLATLEEPMTDWKRLWCWERLRAGAEGGDRRWDG